MGDYTRVGLVRSGTGLTEMNTPSGTVNFCITQGEAALKKYLRLTPATGSNTESWVQSAATSFAAHYLALRLANQNIANVAYQRQTSTDRGSRYGGHALSAEMWWDEACRMCDLHGRDIIIKRVEP